MSHSIGHRPATRHRLPVTVHGHYQVVEPPGEGPHPLLVGFHGYGENAAEHLAELRRVPGSERWLLAAVQGLSLFYRRRTGEVVASWMTKVGREQAILDNRRYAAAVVAALRARYAVAGCPVFLGFSQGVAMAYRAAAEVGASAVIAVCGDIPPELDATGELAALPAVLVTRGHDDAWYDAAKLDADLARLRALGVPCDTLTYSGGHAWTDPLRARVGEYLAAVAEQQRVAPG